jgi:hypothetical protein
VAGPTGTEVTIAGAGFTGTTAVEFGGTAAATFAVDSVTRIRATVPAGATTGPIQVTNAAGPGASADDFTVANPPTVTSFAPTSGPFGTEVTIAGADFAGVVAVTFNDVPADTFWVDSGTQIRAVVSAGASTGPIAITGPAGTGQSVTDFEVIAVTGADLPGNLPVAFALVQNRPNPFGPRTEIRYDLPRATRVRLSVYNLLGQRVVDLVNDHRAAGRYSVRWDGRDASGRRVASGAYVYELRAGDFVARRKMIRVR